MLRGYIVRVTRIVEHIVYIIPRIIKAKPMFGASIKRASLDTRPVYAVRTFAAVLAGNAGARCRGTGRW